MSVFSLDVGTQNPVTAEVLDEICDELGMKIKDDEKEEYQRLLAVYHDSVVSLLELPGELARRPSSQSDDAKHNHTAQTTSQR